MGDQGRSDGVASVIGREAELARLECFVRGASSGSAVLLIGGPGFGKTTLWEAAVGLARDQPARVLTARPSESASQLPFGGLIDLSDDLDSGALAGLPEPQRRALEVALMRAAPASEPAAPAVIAVGLLGVLRRLACRGPVLIAIDDLQSMDAASVGALRSWPAGWTARGWRFYSLDGLAVPVRSRRCSRGPRSSEYWSGRCRWAQ